ncbi:MAG: Flagellar hook-length control protein FliK [Pelotomaculum sp. PtaB.Bin013]|uniref:Flagellar hook-length control protein FliK n=1 Tax=Pelotomaculum isophthalicicum JI TaxID=947010 RepID=A0A9X4H3Z1_9FIRM|nr:flagellar hook-length control protein FliK [Pelotomaculum isophthalicicum]MDF9409981.1 flagellar hook-length control protein FliK [Pelotomaculum isophthalicicum JI]OPX92266.1 MAG: Flagellar hook-length control protein FliK [Pelotomaculum sp. PtaB.Bin013]
MNINLLTNLLFEMTNRNISKVSPAPKPEGAASTRDAMALGKKVLEALDNSQPEKLPTRVETKQIIEPTVNSPAFTPLPLRSELFPEARFFARLNERNAADSATVDRPVTEIFVHIDTDNMGHIWINLSWRNNFLSVKYFTENENSSKILRENFSPIRDALKEIGFNEVSLTSQARAGLGGLTNELLPKFEAYLLNREI